MSRAIFYISPWYAGKFPLVPVSVNKSRIIHFFCGKAAGIILTSFCGFPGQTIV